MTVDPAMPQMLRRHFYELAIELFSIPEWYKYLVEANGVQPSLTLVVPFRPFPGTTNANVADIAAHFARNGISPTLAETFRSFAIRARNVRAQLPFNSVVPWTTGENYPVFVPLSSSMTNAPVVVVNLPSTSSTAPLVPSTSSTVPHVPSTSSTAATLPPNSSAVTGPATSASSTESAMQVDQNIGGGSNPPPPT